MKSALGYALVEIEQPVLVVVGLAVGGYPVDEAVYSVVVVGGGQTDALYGNVFRGGRLKR